MEGILRMFLANCPLLRILKKVLCVNFQNCIFFLLKRKGQEKNKCFLPNGNRSYLPIPCFSSVSWWSWAVLPMVVSLALTFTSSGYKLCSGSCSCPNPFSVKFVSGFLIHPPCGWARRMYLEPSVNVFSTSGVWLERGALRELFGS